MKDIHVSKAYIQLAKDRLEHLKGLLNQGDLDIDAHFGIASVITNYSYAAIEAVVNGSLYKDWIYAKYRFSKDFNEPYVELYNQEQLKIFYDKYGHFENFNDFKNSDLKELKDRLRVMCDLASIKRISDLNGKLWGDVNKLLRDSRLKTDWRLV